MSITADVRCLPDMARARSGKTPHRADRRRGAANPALPIRPRSNRLKETVLEIIGRPPYDQLRVEATWGYALCAGNTTVMERSQQFFEKVRRGRAGAMGTLL